MPDDEKMEESGPSEASAASSPAPSTAPVPGATRPGIPSAGRGPGIYYRCRIPSGTVAMENDLDTDDERDDDLRSQCPTLEALPSLPPIDDQPSSPSKLAVAATAVPEDAPLAAAAPLSLPLSIPPRAALSRAERGRSGRRHRRATGVAERALLVVREAGLGRWPPSAFSRLCNVLKVAPELPPESLRMVLRPRAGAPAVKAGASAALLQWEVALVHPLLAKGSFAFALHEIGAAEERARLVATLPTELPPTPVELDLSAQLGLARFEFPGKATN